MRRPRYQRKKNRKIAAALPGVDLDHVAQQARYVGSPEHKDHASIAGIPKPRADASLCPLFTQDHLKMVNDWLKESIRKGLVGEFWEGEFPRYVWYRDGSTLYEARLVNRGTGEYKGYPLEPDEWPIGL
jgi:hypothetical protein